METLRIIDEMPTGPKMQTIMRPLTELTRAGQLARPEGTWRRYRRAVRPT